MLDTNPATPPDRWTSFVTSTTLTPIQIELLGTLLIQLLFFWLPGTLLLLLHQHLPESESPPTTTTRTHRRRLLPTLHRIPHAPTPTTPPPLANLLTRVLLNQFYLFLTHLLLLTTILPSSPFTVSAPLPSLPKLLGHLALALPLADYLFYIVHRALHTYPVLYRRIHSVHHRWRHPVSFAAQYAHPAEFLVGNSAVVWAPLAAVGWLSRGSGGAGVHVVEWWVMWGGVLLETVVVHGGVEVLWPWSGAGGRGKVVGGVAGERSVIRRHDLHHEVGAGGGRAGGGRRRRRWGNFATFWWMDWVHGTEILGVEGEENNEKERRDSGGAGKGNAEGEDTGRDSGVDLTEDENEEERQEEDTLGEEKIY